MPTAAGSPRRCMDAMDAMDAADSAANAAANACLTRR